MKQLEQLHKVITLTLLGILLSVCTAFAQHPALSGGYGTQEEPYLVSTPEDLMAISIYVNTESGGELYYYELTNDIDMSSIEEFFPINDMQYPLDMYKVSFDGKGHTIKNLNIAKGVNYCGLFGKINGDHLTIANLNIENINIDVDPTASMVYVGGIVGQFYNNSSIRTSQITNCTVSGNINMENYTQACIGGIAGSCTNIDINDCKNYANIKVSYGKVTENKENGIGGIVGKTQVPQANGITKQLIACCNYGSVEGPMNVGGIAGYTLGINIGKCNNSGRIGGYDKNVGGIVGYANSTLIDFCCNIGAVKVVVDEFTDLSTLNAKFIAGIAGYYKVTRTVTKYYPFADNLNAGYVDGWDYTAGITGWADGWVYNNVNVGTISDGSKYKANCKTSSNIACYPYSDGQDKNKYYGGELYDKQMSLQTDSMNGKVFEGIARIAEFYSNQMLYDSIYKNFVASLEIDGPHQGEYEWSYNEGLYAVPNNTDPAFNVLASAVIKLDTSDRANDVNHQFRVVMMETEDEGPTIVSASNNKICKVQGASIGLVGTGKDTLRIYYKGIMREVPLIINSVDTLMFSGGSGMPDDPYLISCLKDLKELEFLVNKHVHAKYPDKNWSYKKYFKVTENIDDKFTGCIGIGGDDLKIFQGNFDGNGKRVTLDIEESNGYAALFGIANEPASIKGLEVNGEIYSCKTGAGIVAIADHITLMGCLNSVNVVATDTAGGVAAIAKNCIISNCGNNGLVRSNKLSGGVIGYAEESEADNLVNGGSVLSANTAGGLLGSTPGTTLNRGVNYGYTGRTVAEIDGTKIGYTIGDKKNGTETNTFWNAQTNTIWDATWETEGLSTAYMMTNAGFKHDLGSNWETSSDTTLPLPYLLTYFEGSKLMTMPFSFDNEWNTLKDINGNLNVPASWFNTATTDFGLGTHSEKLRPYESGKIVPSEFGADTLYILYFHKGAADATQHYRKVVPLFVSAGYLGGGNGTEDDPYLIKTEEQLNTLIADVNNDYYCVDTVRNASWHKYFKQTADFSTEITSPIGKGGRERYEWNGYYDGDGHSLNVNINAAANTGLFGALKKGASISHLTVRGKVNGSDNVGAIAGVAETGSNITDCHSYAKVNGENKVGGIVGYSNGANIAECCNSGAVHGNSHVGGIMGHTRQNSENHDLLNIGDVVGKEYVGGIAGEADTCDIRRAVNAGLTVGKNCTGGVVGKFAWGGISNKLLFECMNYGYVDPDGTHSGAIVGENVNYGTNVTLCFYNNQLTLAKAIDGMDNQGFATGLDTRNLLGNSLDAQNYYLSEYWDFSSNHYPMPSALNCAEAKVARNPILLTAKEIYLNIGNEFTVVNDDDVTWKSTNGNLNIEGEQVSFNHSGLDTLVAELNGVSKRQPIFITNGLFSGGNGSKEKPYLLTCKRDIHDLATYVNTNLLEPNKNKNWSEGLYFSLENDIPEDSVITATIGTPDTDDEIRYIHFGGTFNGHGHRMTVNLYGEENNVGLFGYLSSTGYIDSLTIGGVVKGTSNVGGFVGYCEEGTISHCQNEATIIGNNDAGGICGYASYAKLNGCNNAGMVLSSENKAGGIAGEANFTNIEGCTNIATIEALTLSSYSGGIVGKASNKTEINYCLNAGMVIGENKIGGIVGEAASTKINECLVANEIVSTSILLDVMEGYICGSYAGATHYTNCYYDQQLAAIENANDEGDAVGLATKDMTGTALASILNAEKWTFDDDNYPRPSNDTIALLAASAMELVAKDDNKNVSDAIGLYTFDNCQWNSLDKKVKVVKNEGQLLAFGKDTMTVAYNNLAKKIAIDITCITLHNQDTIVGCDSVKYEGKWYFEDVEFNDTLKSTITGCDSLVGIRVEVHHSTTAPAQPIIYGIGSVEYNGKTYDKDTTVVTRLTNAALCDSVVTQQISIVNTIIRRDTVLAGCDSTLFNDKWFTADTTLEEHLKDEQGRDTVIKFTFIPVNYSEAEPTRTVWAYDSIAVNGKYILADTLIADTTTLANGCTHISSTQYKLGKTVRKYSNKTYCGNGILYLSTGKREVSEPCVVNDTTEKSNELLAITIYNVSIMTPKDTTITLTNCESITFRNTVYTESTQIDEVIETEWCDSTVHYVLNVLKPVVHEETISDCYKVKHKGIDYTDNAVVYDTLRGMAHNGCDSIVATNIVVYQPTTDTLDTYGLEFKDVYGYHVTNDSTIVDTLVNSVGCDSFLVTKVHITHFYRDTIDKYGCDSLMYRGEWFKTSTYIISDTYNPEKAWDDLDQEEKSYLQKTEVIHIIIGNYEEYVTNIDSCEQITFRGKVYTENAEIRDSFVSSTGCDSIMVYRLRLHQPKTEGQLSLTGCGRVSYNGEVFLTDTSFVRHITTNWGCDSICNVNIVVRHPDEVFTTVSGCENVTYDGETFTHDTTLVRVFTNKGGCDSTVHVDIKVYKPSYHTVTYEGEYDVVYKGRKYTRSTVMHDTLVNYRGCDSILTIAIVVLKSLDYPLIVNKYDYMLLCNNNIGKDKYVSYQWYKNNEPVHGETKAYYSEYKGSKLNGCYQVYVKTTDGREYFSEETCIKENKPLTVYPNPVEIGESISIEYDFTEREKNGLYLDVYNSAGSRVYHDMPTQYPIVIPGQHQKGYYFILITTGEDKNMGAKFIVK